ncbi:MAG: glycosyltransferase family 2 protein [Candidatus Omnitrophica bacterium]|nr:glycosyltransferase family 2 protein [Candidatus Omnitrophota bacterium]
MQREKLSVVILTKNEADMVARCLESVKWADEIVIVDDNSKDDTVAVAKKYTDKIIINPLNGDFTKQRNMGTDNSSGDWILQMDQDESVTPELKCKILEILRGGTGHAAFRFKRSNNFCGKFLEFGGENSHRPMRLFKKGRARFTASDIRMDEALEVDGSVGDIDAVMEHYNFPDISRYVVRQDFYSTLEAKALFNKIGIIPEKKLRRELTFGPAKLFFKMYIKRQGCKDGIHGLVFAVLSAWRRFLIYAKYWELNKEHYDKGAR